MNDAEHEYHILETGFSERTYIIFTIILVCTLGGFSVITNSTLSRRFLKSFYGILGVSLCGLIYMMLDLKESHSTWTRVSINGKRGLHTDEYLEHHASNQNLRIISYTGMFVVCIVLVSAYIPVSIFRFKPDNSESALEVLSLPRVGSCESEIWVQSSGTEAILYPSGLVHRKKPTSAVNNLRLRNRLQEAVEDGREKQIELLALSGVDLDDILKDGHTPLQLATVRGDVKSVQTLLERGASPVVKGLKDEAPLKIAIREGQNEIVDAFLSPNYNGSKNLHADTEFYLHLAVDVANLHAVRSLLASGLIDIYLACNPFGYTFKSIPSQRIHGYLAWHKILSSAREIQEPEMSEKRSLSAINESTSIGSTYDSHGITGLRGGSTDDTSSIKDMLIKAYADTTFLDEDGNTALHLAAKHNMIEVIEKLLSLQVDPNSRNYAGETCLHMATCSRSRPDIDLCIIQKLLHAGADVNLKNHVGETSLHTAIRNRMSADIVEKLLQAGANVNMIDDEGWVPIVLAYRFFNDSTISHLLLFGATQNPNLENQITSSARDVNRRFLGYSQLVESLPCPPRLGKDTECDYCHNLLRRPMQLQPCKHIICYACCKSNLHIADSQHLGEDTSRSLPTKSKCPVSNCKRCVIEQIDYDYILEKSVFFVRASAASLIEHGKMKQEDAPYMNPYMNEAKLICSKELRKLSLLCSILA